MSFCITKDKTLQKSTLQFLYDENATEETIRIQETFGGILSNLNYAWLVRKSKFLVVNCKNGLRVGSWDFGNSLQDDTAKIIAVEEIQRPNGKEPHLIISVNCETRGGLICIFDYVGSKIIRAIQVVEHITNIHVIDRGQDLFSLSGPLRNFDGVLAVGTVGGNVFILDICRQLCYEGFNSIETRDELNPCPMQVITSRNLKDLENYKTIALCNVSHLAIFLNVVHNRKTEHFVLKNPDGLDSVHVNREEVTVSALHYCPQLGSILIGYNFGAFQLWNLMSMELIYTSQICDDHIPIIKFAIQEPADDPRAFCYVWAVYSTDDLESKILPCLVMFALCYETKEFHENYGVLYENFQGCTVRFQRELGYGNNQSNMKPPIGGRCLRLDSLVLKNLNTNNDIFGNDGAEDALSLCVTAWKVVCEDGQQFTFMSVFDLNQWYKAQMPNSSNFDECASYMMTLCISDLTLTDSENEVEVLDVNLHKKTIQQFVGTQRLEEHYYPSSLSFETSCLLEHKIVNIQYQGVQKALLCQLQTSGPLCLIRPSDTYQEIIALGLTPLFVDLNTNSAITSLNDQREVILNVALEQQLTSWLCKCASDWANGSFSSAGCSLDLLTSWAFRRAIALKRQCDYLSVPLFDYSDDKLDANTVNILSNCIRQIKIISFVFSFILSKLSSYLTNKDVISEQYKNLQMIEMYFDVLQWFFNVGLLPEYPPFSANPTAQESKVRAPYPVRELEEYYKKKRSELMLAMSKKFSSRTSILFIDSLINVECGGDRLGKDWEKDGGDGFYPPRSLQALLRTYLLDGIEVCNKHSVIIYLLVDLAVILDLQYKNVLTNLVKFPAVFKVSPSSIKITHAFWQLDHGEFNSAIEHLLDPMVNQNDLKNWHHKVALKSLLVQEQHNLALLYMSVRKPPIIDDEDVLCALSLFISNNMLDEAFYLEKNFKDYTTSKRIIKHLFKECCNYGRLSSIIYRNLTAEEEEQFLKYLDEVDHPEAADLKITYFMQRSHYIEAFKTYQACEDDPMKKGLISRLNLKARDQIVHSYKKFLPTVSYKFIESCTTELNPTLWKEVSKPDPMSVCVQKGDEKTEYKSSLILAALAKAKLTFNESVQNVSLANATTEEIPFLRTPTLMPTKKRSSVQIIIPKIVLNDGIDEEDGPTPPKRSKLCLSSFSQLSEIGAELNSSILSTPIIVRKNRGGMSSAERNAKDMASTPASILKVRNSYKKDFQNISSPNMTSGSSNTPLRPSEHKSFVSGRKSTRISMVRFDVPSSTSEEPSSSLKLNSSERYARTPEKNETISFENSSRSISRSLTPKNASDTDDIYYSPNSSLNNIEELPKDKSDDENDAKKDQEFTLKLSPEKPPVISKAERVKLVDYDASSSSKEGTDPSLPSTPRGRRSYKKLSSEITHVRSSPRLSRSSAVTERERGGSDDAIAKNAPPSLISFSKVKKSLNRKVLEANTLARVSSDEHTVETSRTEIIREEKKTSSVFNDDEKTETSQITIECTTKSYSCTTEANMDLDSPGLDGNQESADSFVEVQYDDISKDKTIESTDAQSTDSGSKKEPSFDFTPIRSNSRSSKILHRAFAKSENSGSDAPMVVEERSPSISSIKSRKSLNRRVLEANTLARFASNDDNVMTKTEISNENKKASGLVLEDEKTDMSSTNIESSESSCAHSAQTTIYSESGENLEGLDDNMGSPSSGISDSFIEVLYNDLCKRKTWEDRPSAASDSKQEGSLDKPSTVVRETTPLRMTRRLSRRLSEERALVSDSTSISQNNKQDKVPFLSIKKQTRASSVDRLIPSTPNKPSTSAERISEEKSPTSGNSTHLSDNANPSKDSKTPLTNRKKTIISTPHTGSVEKILKLNRPVKSTPLSRRVIEKNALLRIASSYDTSSNEETENMDTEMIDSTEQNVKNEGNLSISDSFLEEIAFGKLPKEKELLEECRRSIFTGNTQKNVPSDSGGIELSKENVKVTTETITITENDEDNIQQGVNFENENKPNNPEQIVFEISDDVRNQTIPESLGIENETVSEFESQRQDNVTPTVFERNIFGSDMESSNESMFESSKNSKHEMKIIEISSTDEMESKSSSSESKNSTSNDNNQRYDENISDMIYGDLDSGDGQNSEMNCDLNKGMIGDISIDEEENNKIDSQSDADIISRGVESDSKTVTKKNVDKTCTEKENPDDNKNKPVKRMTRRLSKQLEDRENESIGREQTEEVQVQTEKSSGGQRGSISRRSSHSSKPNLDLNASSSVNPDPELPEEAPRSISARKRTRSVDLSLNSQLQEASPSTSKTSGVLRAKRKLRSASVDVPSVIDEEIKKESPKIDKTRKKPSSLSGVEVIKEEKKDKKTLEPIKEVVSYKTSRRLTRRQSNILEQSLDKIDLSAILPQDPIELLDKPEFKGTPDPQEQKVYEISPSSTSSAKTSNTGRPAKRLGRANSNASDDSLASTKSTSSRRKAVATPESQPAAGSRRKLRSASTDGESKSTRRAKEKTPDMSDDSGESDMSVLSTRSRKSNTEDSSTPTKRKRKVATKSALPEIKEENLEGGSPAQNTRRGRKTANK